jgi:predicted transcriptional regulator
VNEGETLSNLIQMAIDHDSAIVVEDAGKDIGVITRRIFCAPSSKARRCHEQARARRRPARNA